MLKNTVEKSKDESFSLDRVAEPKLFEEEAEFVPFYVVIKLNVPPRRKWRGCARAVPLIAESNGREFVVKGADCSLIFAKLRRAFSRSSTSPISPTSPPNFQGIVSRFRSPSTLVTSLMLMPRRQPSLSLRFSNLRCQSFAMMRRRRRGRFFNVFSLSISKVEVEENEYCDAYGEILEFFNYFAEYFKVYLRLLFFFF